MLPPLYGGRRRAGPSAAAARSRLANTGPRFADWRLAALALATVLVAYAGRTAVVRFVVSPSTRRFDASVMAVMGPKGLAAAVLAGVPLQRGVEQGELMQQFTYLVVLASIAVTSAVVPMIEHGPRP